MNKKLLFSVLLIAATTTVFCPKGKKPPKGASKQEKKEWRDLVNQSKKPVLLDLDDLEAKQRFYQLGKKGTRVAQREAAIAASAEAARKKRGKKEK